MEGYNADLFNSAFYVNSLQHFILGRYCFTLFSPRAYISVDKKETQTNFDDIQLDEEEKIVYGVSTLNHKSHLRSVIYNLDGPL